MPYKLMTKPPVVLAGLLLMTMSSAGFCSTPLTIFDGRSAGLGGVGVAANARNAAYSNPALLGTNIEAYDAVLLAPVYGQATTDPDNLKQGIDDMRALALTSNTTAIQSQLNKIKGLQYQQDTVKSLTFIVPSTIIGATAFVNNYTYNSARTTITGTDAPPTYTSTLDHRAVKITEIGGSAGTLLDASGGFFGGLQVGVSAKIMLLENYGYSEPIDNASLKIDDNPANLHRDSMMNLDVGAVREYGVWKLGLVVKNILSGDFQYGDSGDTFKIGPQARFGMAYQSRRTLVEMDFDLTQNKAIGYGQDSQYAALGWEYELFYNFYVRAGARQNLTGDKLSTATLGLGYSLRGFALDIGAMANSDETAGYGNFSYEF